MKKKIISTVLLLAMMANTLIACQGDTNPEDTSDSVSTSDNVSNGGETTLGGRENTPDSLPDGLNYDGATIRIYALKQRDSDASAGQSLDVGAEIGGNPVSDTIYYRDKAVESRLNVDLETYAPYTTMDYYKAVAEIRQSVSSGQEDFQIIAGYLWHAPTLAVEGLFTNLHNVQYLDFDQPWWIQSMVENLTINDVMHFATGDISLSMLASAFTIAQNTTLAEDIENFPNVFSIVREGNWTLDKMMELSSSVLHDLDGDGEIEIGDRIGFFVGSTHYNLADAFIPSSRLTMTSRNAEGLPVIDVDQEKFAALAEKLYKLYYEAEGSLYESKQQDWKVFEEGNVMFTAVILDRYRVLGDMKDDYAILPLPKLDENQKEYGTGCQDSMTIWGIPKTVEDKDRSGAVMEAMAAESYRNVTEVYFETAIKDRYARDPESLEMLDIIRDGIFMTLETTYLDTTGRPALQMRKLIVDYQSPNWASRWAMDVKSMEKTLADLSEKMAKLAEED